MKTPKFQKSLLVLFVSIILVSCEKNQAPTVQIIKPVDGYTVTKGDIIPISVSAGDAEGTVSEVRLFLDETGLIELEFPYNYDMNTDAYHSGEYTLKVTARDNEGLESSDEINIIIDAAFSSISTAEATTISYNSALVGGTVSDDGGGEITETGVYWDTLSSPETNGHKISMSQGLGEFSGSITELPHGKKIFHKAYSVNSAGLALGEERFFETNTVPTVLTASASSIDYSSAMLGGEIITDGGEAVTERGVYWSSESMAGVIGTRLVIEEDEDSFATTLEELSIFTTYYFKAFAANAAGESLGDEQSFTTTGPATVTTLPVVTIRYKQVLVGGEVSDDGGNTVSETGVYWGSSADPVSSGTRYSIVSEEGNFSGPLPELNAGNIYYIVAFAVNDAGESLGEEISYDLDPETGTFIDSRDQEEYGTIKIGEQVWMSENLRATQFNDGTEIPHLPESLDWAANSGPAYCLFNNDPEMAEWATLYNWYTVDTKKLCPSGWHIPSEAEFQELELFLGMDAQVVDTDGFRGANVGGMLKTTTHWDQPNTGASDELGFSVLPAGRRGAEGEFVYGTQACYYWQSDLGPWDHPWRRLFHYEEGGISRSVALRNNALSVRCVMDE